MNAPGCMRVLHRGLEHGTPTDVVASVLALTARELPDGMRAAGFDQGKVNTIYSPHFLRNMDAGRGPVLVVEVRIFWASPEQAAALEKAVTP